MGNRKALLIGASDYEAPGIRSLPFIPGDLRALGQALERRGFSVSIPQPRGQASPNFINGEMARFLKQAHPGDSLLAFLSGHGIHAQGQDYFIPEDAHPEIEPFEASCVAIDWKREVEQSPAEHIVILIDACREGVQRDSKDVAGYVNWSRRRVKLEGRRRFAYVYACSPGQMARFVSPADQGQYGGAGGVQRGESFSLFSRAVSDVLLRDPDALHLSAFQERVQDRVEELHRAYGKTTPPQQLRVLMHAPGTQAEFPVVGPMAAADSGDDSGAGERDGFGGREAGLRDRSGDTRLRAGADAMAASAPSVGLKKPADPRKQMAEALYRLQYAQETAPLLAFAAEGPATEILELQRAGIVSQEVQEQIWDACALRRSGAALLEMLGQLRQAGDKAREGRLLDAALRGRVPHEVLQGLNVEQVHELLAYATTKLPAPALVDWVISLHGTGHPRHAGRLLHAAVQRPLNELPLLLAALRQAGLMAAVSGVLAHCGRHFAPDAVCAVVTVLNSSGRGADSRHVLNAVARRSAADIAACVAALHAAGCAEDVAEVLTAAAVRDPHAVLDLARALAAGSGEADATLLVQVAARRFPASRLTDLILLLHQRHAPLPSAHVVVSAAVEERRPSELLYLVRTLCARWLDEEARRVLNLWVQARPMSELPPLMASLDDSGHHSETDHILATLATDSSMRTVTNAFAALREAGQRPKAQQLLAMVMDLRPYEDLGELFGAVRAAQGAGALKAALSRVAVDKTRPVAELVPLLAAMSLAETPPVTARAVIDKAARLRPLADIVVLRQALHAAKLVSLGSDLWRTVTQRRRCTDLIDLVGILSTAGASPAGSSPSPVGPQDLAHLLHLMAQHRSVHDLAPLIESLGNLPGNAAQTASTLRSHVANCRSITDLATIVSATPAAQRQALTDSIGHARSVDEVAGLARELATRGQQTASRQLASAAAAQRPPKDQFGLLRQLLSAQADAAAEQILIHLASEQPPSAVIETLYGRYARHEKADVAVVQRILRTTAQQRRADELYTIIAALRDAGMQDEAQLALHAAGQWRTPADLFLLLRELAEGPYPEETGTVLAAAAGSRSGSDLTHITFTLSEDSALCDQILAAVAVHSPVPALADVLEAMAAEHESDAVRRIVETAFNHDRHADLAALLQHLSFTHPPRKPRDGAAAPAAVVWDTCLTHLASRSPLQLAAWGRTLHAAGTPTLGTEALVQAATQPTEKLVTALASAQASGWTEDAQLLLNTTVFAGQLQKLATAWRTTARDASALKALEHVLDRLPLTTLAVHHPPNADDQRWAMKRCPSSELIPALVTAFATTHVLHEPLLEMFFRCRPISDFNLLLRALHDEGHTQQARDVARVLTLSRPVDAVVTFISDLDRAKGHDVLTYVLDGASDGKDIPIRLLMQLRQQGMSAYADHIINSVIENPRHYPRLPQYATTLARHGLLDHGRWVMEAYAGRCPDGRLVQAIIDLDATPELRRWRSLLTEHVAAQRTLQVLRHVLLELRAVGASGAGAELLDAVERHRAPAETAGLRAALKPDQPGTPADA